MNALKTARALVVVLALVLAIALGCAAQASAAALYQTGTYYGKVNSNGTKTLGPLKYNATTGDFRDSATVLLCERVPMTAGHLVDVNYWLELANENTAPATPDGTLWMMGATFATYSTTGCTTSGSTAGPIPQQETNWNWWMHYLDVDRSAWWIAPVTGNVYIAVSAYFDASVDYVVNTPYVIAQPGTYARLQVATF